MAYRIDCEIWRTDIARRIASVTATATGATADFFRQAQLAADGLPEALRAALHAFRLVGNADGVLLLRHFPSADPATGGDASDSERMLALVASRLGDIVGYRQEKQGALFQDVRPHPDKASEQASEGSLVQLEYHTERCFHPYLPAYVLLYCIRPDAARMAETFFASVRAMRPLLDPDACEVLFQPLFRTGIDYSFGNTGTVKANGPVMSVLYGSREDPFLRYDLDLMVGLTAAAQQALDAVRQAAGRVQRGVCLQQGDLLIIDNRRAIHGRHPFTPHYNDSDRWLKRAYVVSDIHDSAADRSPGERVIGTRFDV